MRGLKQDRSAGVIITRQAFVHKGRPECYELAGEEPITRRLAVASLGAPPCDLIPGRSRGFPVPRVDTTQL
jgi:hypothetical protein